MFPSSICSGEQAMVDQVNRANLDEKRPCVLILTLIFEYHENRGLRGGYFWGFRPIPFLYVISYKIRNFDHCFEFTILVFD